MSRRAIVLITVLIGLAASAGPLVVLVGAERGEAAFGDGETFGLNQLASASVAVEVGEQMLLLDASAMAPGDRLSGRFALTNAGTLPIRYSIVAEAEDASSPLLRVLEWSLWVERPQTPCTSAPVSGLLFEGLTFARAVNPEVLVGDPAVGPDPGDRVLEPDTSESLCVQVELPLDVGDVFQGTSARVEITVNAEQATEADS